MKLSKWPLPYVRLGCEKCGKEGKLSTARLEDKFGSEADMSMVREEIAAPSCKRPTQADPCRAIYLDAMLVDAIVEENRDRVLQPDLIPEAEKWRAGNGLPSRGW